MLRALGALLWLGPLVTDAVGIDVEIVGAAETSRFEAELRSALGARLRALGIGPRRRARDPVLMLVVEPVGEGYRFELASRTEHGTTPLLEDACATCGEVEVMAAVVERIGADLIAPPATEVPTAGPLRSVPATGSDRAVSSRWSGGMVAGVSVLALGVGVGVAGVPLWLAGRPLIDEDAGDRLRDHLDLRPSAIAAFAVGGALAVAGSVVLGVTAHRHRARVSAAAGGLRIRF